MPDEPVKYVHVFPVPHGMTPGEALLEANTLGKFHGYRWWKPKFWFMKWCVVIEDDDET